MKLWVLLLLLPGMAYGQSLAATAEKEKQRRERLREDSPPAPIITGEELAKTTGRLANDPGDPGDTDPADALANGEEVDESGLARLTDDPPAPRAATPNRIESERAERDQKESIWRKRAIDAENRVEYWQQRSDRMQRQIRLGQGYRTDANGRRYMISLGELQSRANEADTKLVEAKQALAELRLQARRAGVPPGWLR